MNAYRIITMGSDSHDIEADSPEQAVVTLMETHYSDYGAKWSAHRDDNVPHHFDIRQRGQYVTYAHVRSTDDQP